jgi:hypothetical protein
MVTARVTAIACGYEDAIEEGLEYKPNPLLHAGPAL